MTSIKEALNKASAGTSQQTDTPGIDNPCLVRKSARIYELVNPQNSKDYAVTFDVGQIKQFVLFDSHLRRSHTSAVSAIPSAYMQFAERFNQHAKGSERFATIPTGLEGEPHLSVEGAPIIWEHFMIDDALVGCAHAETSPDYLLNGSDDFVMVESTEEYLERKELEVNVKYRIKLLEELEEFYHLRAILEDQYSSGLRTLSEKITGVNESKEVHDVLTTFQKETIKQSQEHASAADKIRNTILCDLIKMTKKHRKLLEDELAKELATLHCDSDFVDISKEAGPKNKQEGKDLQKKVAEMEVERLIFLKGVFWDYANLVSTTCVSDDDSCEKIRLKLEDFEPAAQAEGQAPVLVDNRVSDCSATSRPGCMLVHRVESPYPPPLQCTIGETGQKADQSVSRPLPIPAAPFQVKALYNFTGKLPEDLNFTKGDTLLVTSTSDDGWWVGEHVDKSKKSDGKFLFPCNYVQRIPAVAAPPIFSSHITESPSDIVPSELVGSSVSTFKGNQSFKFFVRALYNYDPDGPMDMGFDKGDIIGIYATPESGWWYGELKDTYKRAPGKYILPSNFVERTLVEE